MSFTPKLRKLVEELMANFDTSDELTWDVSSILQCWEALDVNSTEYATGSDIRAHFPGSYDRWAGMLSPHIEALENLSSERKWTVIVQRGPLLAASCETILEDHRLTVTAKYHVAWSHFHLKSGLSKTTHLAEKAAAAARKCDHLKIPTTCLLAACYAYGDTPEKGKILLEEALALDPIGRNQEPRGEIFEAVLSALFAFNQAGRYEMVSEFMAVAMMYGSTLSLSVQVMDSPSLFYF